MFSYVKLNCLDQFSPNFQPETLQVSQNIPYSHKKGIRGGQLVYIQRNNFASFNANQLG